MAVVVVSEVILATAALVTQETGTFFSAVVTIQLAGEDGALGTGVAVFKGLVGLAVVLVAVQIPEIFTKIILQKPCYIAFIARCPTEDFTC